MRFATQIPAGEVLDLACGKGRHTRFLVQLGYRVVALDRDSDVVPAFSELAGVTSIQFDLEEGKPWPFEADRFSGIVVTNYLHRPLFPYLLQSLAPGGMLIYETFAQGNAAYGRPSRSAFLLNRGELLSLPALEATGRYHIHAFEDGYVESPVQAVVQRICLSKRSGEGATPSHFQLDCGEPHGSK